MNDKKIQEYEKELGMHITEATAMTNAENKSVVAYKIEGSNKVYEEPYRKFGFLKNDKAVKILKAGKYNHLHEYLKNMKQAEKEVAADEIVPTQPMNTPNKELPNNIDINKKKFKKGGKAKFVLIPLALFGMFKIGESIPSFFTKKDQPEDNNQKATTVATEDVNAKTNEESNNPSEYLEKFYNQCADADKYLNQELGLNVPYETIPSMMFVCNCQYMKPADVKMLVEDEIVPASGENVMQNALILKNIVVNQNDLALYHPDMKMVDLSCFSINKGDNAFAKRLYNDLVLGQQVVNNQIGTKTDGIMIFNNFFYWCTNDSKTQYNYTIQNGTSTQQYTAGCYTSTFCEIGGESGVQQETIDLLQHKIKDEDKISNGTLSIYEVISGFDKSTNVSSVNGNLGKGCDPTNEEETNTKTR